MKKFIAIMTGTLMIIGFCATQASAGAARRHTLEGFAIGTGVAILGAALYHEIHKDKVRAVPAPAHRPPHHHNKYDHHSGYNDHGKKHHRKNHRHDYQAGRRGHDRHFKGYRGHGHWEVEKRWVPPVYEKRWNPGHYNRRGKWRSGHYTKILVRDGYYKKVKIWVRH